MSQDKAIRSHSEAVARACCIVSGSRLYRRLCLFGIACLFFLHSAAPALAQYRVARTEFGDPDLQGLWTNASITTLERPPYLNRLVVSAQEAQAIERATTDRMDSDRRPSDPKAGAPQAGDDVRGYNTFWLDLGSRLAVVKGEIRTSWVVDPPTGRVPYSAEGYRALRAAAATSSDGPESRTIGDRCIVGYGSTSGPPMLNVLYNNHYQIVQSPGFVTIVVEMNHDARIIRLGGKHPPEHVKLWMGDSIGRWDADTLVVETTNFHPRQAFTADVRHRIYLPPTARVTERFTRVSPGEILYEFLVEDSTAYTQAWRGEMTLNATKGPMYEYACHEGNHSMANILRGARYQEKNR